MKTREEAIAYGLSFEDTYRDAPFHDANWQLVRYKGNKKAFLWTGSIPEQDVKLMIAESYDLVSDNPSKRIYEAVKRIPYGRVATYAQIAEAAGDRKMARAVGNALHKNPDPAGIPCYRVVNSKGELAGEFAFGGAGQQAKLLAAEGIEVTGGVVDLSRYQWKNEV